jgi:hypothetical protein
VIDSKSKRSAVLSFGRIYLREPIDIIGKLDRATLFGHYFIVSQAIETVEFGLEIERVIDINLISKRLLSIELIR